MIVVEVGVDNKNHKVIQSDVCEGFTIGFHEERRI